MPAPPYKIVNYPVFGYQVSTVSGFGIGLRFDFPTVPQGEEWTYTLLPCLLNAPVSGGMSNYVWTLIRSNGLVPGVAQYQGSAFGVAQELTWYGYDFPTELTAVAGDQISVIVQNVQIGDAAAPQTYTLQTVLTLKGYALPAGMNPPKTPKLVSAGEQAWLPLQGALRTSLVKPLTGSDTWTVPGLPSGGISIIGVEFSVSYFVTVSGVALGASIQLVDSGSGNILAYLPVAAGGSSSAATTNGCEVFIPINQYLMYTAFSSGLQVVAESNTSDVDGAFSVTVYYNNY